MVAIVQTVFGLIINVNPALGRAAFENGDVV
jgi:hypothetical protein